MKDFTFSILIANYNYANFVSEAIESCLTQNYPSELIEIIIVDDGSIDDSREVLSRFTEHKNVQIVFQENQGQITAFRTAFKHSSNELICLLDADDLFLPSKLKRINEFLNLYQDLPDEFLLCNDVKVEIVEEKKFLPQSWFRSNHLIHPEAEFRALSQIAHPYPFAVPCGQTYSRQLLKKVLEELRKHEIKSAFDDPMPHGGALLSGGVHYLYEELSVYRLHKHNHFLGLDNNSLKPKFKISDKLPILTSFLTQLAFNQEQIQYIDELTEVIQRT
ncbi:MAG: glycosyltransferase family 2 protein [Candidatus Caenarcaniphilales bacterium]|nr:glycosyltransferase family 2 protein [Candidatus Caenarcaniphilales bacterium]